MQLQAVPQKALWFLRRLALAWLAVCLFFLLYAGSPFTDAEFYARIPPLVFFTAVAVGTAALLLLKNELAVTVLLTGTAAAYFTAAAWRQRSFPFSLGLCCVLCAIVLLCDWSDLRVSLGRRGLVAAAAALGAAFVLFVGGLCCLAYWNNWTSCYDFGIFSQMFYYMKETGQCLTTCERDGLLSHLTIHFSPIVYLLLPAYALVPSPCTLLVGQAVVVASGVAPLVLLCRRKGLTRVCTVLFAACYVLYPTFAGGSFYYFHENCFLAPLLLWLFYFEERGSLPGILASAALVLLVKEDAFLYVVAVAAYCLLAGRNRRLNAALLAGALAYFFAVTRLMSLYGSVAMTDRYNNYIFDGGGLLSVVKTVLENPVYAVQQIFSSEKMLYLLEMLLPLGFLPLVSRRPERFVLLVPFVLVNLMPAYVYQYDIHFHYGFGSGTLVVVLAVLNYADLGGKRRRFLLCAALSAVIVFAGQFAPQADYVSAFRNSAHERYVMQTAFASVPEDASVAASTFLVPGLSQRREVYEQETTAQSTQYVVLDLRDAANLPREQQFRAAGCTEVFYAPGTVVVLARGAAG